MNSQPANNRKESRPVLYSIQDLFGDEMDLQILPPPKCAHCKSEKIEFYGMDSSLVIPIGNPEEAEVNAIFTKPIKKLQYACMDCGFHTRFSIDSNENKLLDEVTIMDGNNGGHF